MPLPLKVSCQLKIEDSKPKMIPAVQAGGLWMATDPELSPTFYLDPWQGRPICAACACNEGLTEDDGLEVIAPSPGLRCWDSEGRCSTPGLPDRPAVPMEQTRRQLQAARAQAARLRSAIEQLEDRLLSAQAAEQALYLELLDAEAEAKAYAEHFPDESA